jgi:hypothetical protein
MKENQGGRNSLSLDIHSVVSVWDPDMKKTISREILECLDQA